MKDRKDIIAQQNEYADLSTDALRQLRSLNQQSLILEVILDIRDLLEEPRLKEPEWIKNTLIKCPNCKQMKPFGEVYDRECAYAKEIQNSIVIEFSCGDCEHQHNIDI